MIELPEDELKRVAEAVRDMSSAIAKLSKVQSEILAYNRKACQYVRVSSEKIEIIKAKAIERQE